MDAIESAIRYHVTRVYMPQIETLFRHLNTRPDDMVLHQFIPTTNATGATVGYTCIWRRARPGEVA